MLKDTSRLTRMREKREEAVVGLRKFLLLKPKSENSPICFVEGEDAKYYTIRVKQLCDNNKPEFIVCNGKKGVISSINKVRELNKDSKVKLFAFVDSDFDKKLNNPYIYETPCYSIENFYTTKDVISDILCHEFKLDPIDEKNDYDICMSIFEARQREFHDSISLLNAWILSQRNLSKDSSKLNLKNYDKKVMKEFLDINIDKVEKKYDYEKIIQTFSEAELIPLEEVLSNEKKLKLNSPQKLFRGKYEIEFIRVFIEKLKRDFSTDLQYVSKKKSIDLQLSPSNIISQLSQYAETPDCLSEYISKIWNENKTLAS